MDDRKTFFVYTDDYSLYEKYKDLQDISISYSMQKKLKDKNEKFYAHINKNGLFFNGRMCFAIEDGGIEVSISKFRAEIVKRKLAK